MPEGGSSAGYALELADGSYAWYRYAAIKARRYYRATETLQLIVSAAIPVSAVLIRERAEIPAVLGGIIVVITGLRSIFHWHDDYIRFSEAREAVEAERRLYLTHSEPYDDPATRDQKLANSITRIEQKEMGTWIKIARPQNQPKKPSA